MARPPHPPVENERQSEEFCRREQAEIDERQGVRAAQLLPVPEPLARHLVFKRERPVIKTLAASRGVTQQLPAWRNAIKTGVMQKQSGSLQHVILKPQQQIS